MATTIFERSPPSQSVVAASLADGLHRPFWLDDVPPRPAFPALASDVTTDLAIVGGGFLGLWTAVLAKERDPNREVVLLESSETGWAASSRNGGFCKTSLTHGEENGRNRWPSEFDRLEKLGHQNLDEFEATLLRYGIDCDFERTGVMKFAVEPYQADILRAKHGFLSESQVRAEVASPTFLAGHVEPEHALLHPAAISIRSKYVRSREKEAAVTSSRPS